MSKLKMADCATELGQNMKSKCSQCFGLCCVALFFAKGDGFPEDKVAGKPCKHLEVDFTCRVHDDLRDKGLKGCVAYDCFGAGQKVSQVTFAGKAWERLEEGDDKETSREENGLLFDSFVVMSKLHQRLWYLLQGRMVEVREEIQKPLDDYLKKTYEATFLSGESLLNFDINEDLEAINKLLRTVADHYRQPFILPSAKVYVAKRQIGGRGDMMGEDLKKVQLRGADLGGALMMAADLRNVDLSGAILIGADMRDANLGGANLSKCLYLTQGQLGSVKGNHLTKIPGYLHRPSHWKG